MCIYQAKYIHTTERKWIAQSRPECVFHSIISTSVLLMERRFLLFLSYKAETLTRTILSGFIYFLNLYLFESIVWTNIEDVVLTVMRKRVLNALHTFTSGSVTCNVKPPTAP